MRWAGRIVSLGALTGIVTSVLVNLLGQSRILVALGRQHLLPPWIVSSFLPAFPPFEHVSQAVIDEKHGTPKNALFVNWAASGILALLFDIDILARMVSMGTLFVLTLVSLGAIQRMYISRNTPQSNVWPALVSSSRVDHSKWICDRI